MCTGQDFSSCPVVSENRTIHESTIIVFSLIDRSVTRSKMNYEV